MEFDTAMYEWAHGFRPRGRGTWAFQIGSLETPVWAPTDVLYSEAKKWIRKNYPDATYVRVLT
jgi:hypothetical protein